MGKNDQNFEEMFFLIFCCLLMFTSNEVSSQYVVYTSWNIVYKIHLTLLGDRAEQKETSCKHSSNT